MSDQEDRDLQGILDDVTFEVQTRGARFERIGTTEPDDPSHVEILKMPSEPSGDPVLDTLGRLADTLGQQIVMTSRISMEIAKSLGFDVGTLQAVVTRLVEQDQEIEALQQAVDDLRRRL
ncbi:hypothetical protein [Nocardioides sp.]|uniref:hypothetical protein n=1 Tax=Nocardioides sp. TaxID=35761 RepID=UPI002B792849|nr:hypothetical protein [Nocardioides sp.]HXH79108.1 hypothetical protein [Nocardioides sp.]